MCTKADFINVQFRWGFWAQSWEFSGGGGGGEKIPSVEVTVKNKEEKSYAFVPMTSKNSASIVKVFFESPRVQFVHITWSALRS